MNGQLLYPTNFGARWVTTTSDDYHLVNATRNCGWRSQYGHVPLWQVTANHVFVISRMPGIFQTNISTSASSGAKVSLLMYTVHSSETRAGQVCFEVLLAAMWLFQINQWFSNTLPGVKALPFERLGLMTFWGDRSRGSTVDYITQYPPKVVRDESLNNAHKMWLSNLTSETGISSSKLNFLLSIKWWQSSLLQLLYQTDSQQKLEITSCNWQPVIDVIPGIFLICNSKHTIKTSL